MMEGPIFHFVWMYRTRLLSPCLVHEDRFVSSFNSRKRFGLLLITWNTHSSLMIYET